MEPLDTDERPSVADLGPHVRGVIAAVALGFAIGVVGVLVAKALNGLTDQVLYAPLLAAVAVAVWVAGRPGVLAALFSGWALFAYVIVPPRMSASFASRDEFVGWAASLVLGIVIAGVGIAMRRGQERAARAAENEERSRLRVERLQALAAALSAALTVEEVAGVMVEGVPNAIGARGGALGLVEGQELVIVDPRGARGQTLRPGARFPLSAQAPITTAAREGKPAWVQRRAEFVSRFGEGAALAPYASGALAVPVFVGERLAGAMGFPFQQPDAITAEVRALARIAADLGGQALERAGLYELERSSRESLDRVLAVAPRFQQGATLEAVVVSICAEARRAFGCDAVQIWTPVDEEQLEVAWRDPPSDVIPPGRRIAFADFPGLIEEMRAFRSMFVPNAQLKTRGEALHHAQRLGLYSSLRIPIVIGAKFERILALQWEREIPEPAPSVIAVMRRFADQAGLAMEQAERRRAQEETRELQAVTEALAAAATPSDVGLAIVSQGVKALKARAATVYALREDGTGLDLIASEGYSPETMSAWEQIPLEVQTPLTDALRSGEIIVCASPEEIAERYPWFDDSDQSFVAAPLLAAGRVIGGIFIGSGEARQYGGNLSLIVSLARQAGQALDRAQLFESERASVGRLRKLQAVTAALSQAVTVEDVSRTCLEHATTGVGALAGVVVLRGIGEDAALDRVSVVSAIGLEGPDGEIPAAAAQPIAASLRGGAPASFDGGWIAFPLASGALVVQLPSGRPISDPDREWLLTLVSQSEQALDRAGRYETERGIAETMQRSVLPERLPTVSGVTLAARYLPGTVGVDVGGDWYDIIQLEDGSIGLVVGDVVGKGVQAAAMMGQLRNALRAFAFEYDDPHTVVSRLDKLVEGMMDSAFATLVYLVVDPHQRRAQYVVAGHPPPLIRSADGTTSFLEQGRSLPIGVDASLEFEAGEVQLEQGSTILLYTDGLVERRSSPLDEGLRRLAEAASASEDDPEELVESVLGALIGDNERPDDIAVLAIRFAAPVLDDLRLVLPSTQNGLIEMREVLRAWLKRGRVDTGVAAEAVLAVWEACANAVEHAQDPSQSSFRLRATLDDGGRMRIEVRDSGQWKAGTGSAERGLGLGLMRSFMDTVEVSPSSDGTAVVMERVVPPGAV
jgi:anti-sigma regulatory factor (Ser/Thr protein kinase)/GAF domain-containing protein